MLPSQKSLEFLLTITRLLRDDHGKACLGDFNSFLTINRAFYTSLNRAIWQESVESKSTDERAYSRTYSAQTILRASSLFWS
jgi:hypothetical protein